MAHVRQKYEHSFPTIMIIVIEQKKNMNQLSHQSAIEVVVWFKEK